MHKILFVCHGNICRSPMAEYIMKNLTNGYKNFEIASKATSKEEIGNDIFPPVKNILDKKEIIYDKHTASQITENDFEYYDYVIIMDSNNLYNINKMFGKKYMQKVKKLLYFSGVDADIDDPWYTGEYEKCFSEIEKGCKSLLNFLLNLDKQKEQIIE